MPDERDRDAAAPEASPPAFEEALERLEGVVRELESGALSLEESLVRFEEGVKLVKLCQARLEAARLQVKRLEEGPDGPVEIPADDEETA